MATAGSIIAGALRKLSQIGAGEVPTDDEYTDGLEALNALLDAWRNDKLMCYAMREETLPLDGGTAAYTIGPTGDLTTTRPVEIALAYIVDGGITYAVRLIDEGQYAAIADKATESDWPDRLLFRPTMPDADLIVWPVPNATRTLKMLTRVPFTAFADTTDAVTLPPGWERALVNNLAIEIAPEYEAQVPGSVLKAASESLAGIKRANRFAQPDHSTTELGRLFGARGGSNILTG